MPAETETRLTVTPGGPTSLRPFRRALVAVVVVFALLCGALAAVNLLTGPRLLSFDVDTTGVVSQPNQRLVIETNRQLSPVVIEQITVEPAAAVTVNTAADSLVLTFSQPLAYNTDYRVSVTDVSSLSSGPATDLEVSFRTDEPPMFYLSRGIAPASGGAKAADRILRTGIGPGETRTVFEAPYIQEFVTIGIELAVVTVNDDLTSTLNRVDSDGRAAPLTLPGFGTVHDLQAASAQSLLGFRFTSDPQAPGADTGPLYDSTLFLFELATGAANPVLGLDGGPVQVTAWGFMPFRAELVAQLFDTTLLLINPQQNTEPIPIGQFSAITAFAPDGRRIAVSDASAQFVLDLSEGTENTVAPETVAGTTRYTAGLEFLAGGDGYVQRLAEFDPVTGVARQYLTLVVDGEEDVIYAPASAQETIVGFTVSPNDQYVAVQIVPNRDTAVTDGYPVLAQATDATTLFVSIATGQITRSVVGFAATWQ
ncbi:MAG: hypothetical protein R6W83_12575 [Cryobacterium sp.]